MSGAHGCEWVLDRGYWKGSPCGASGVMSAPCGMRLCTVHRGMATDPERLAKQPNQIKKLKRSKK